MQILNLACHFDHLVGLLIRLELCGGDFVREHSFKRLFSIVDSIVVVLLIAWEILMTRLVRSIDFLQELERRQESNFSIDADG